MRIAIPYENGNICNDFANTETFKLYDTVGGSVAFSQELPVSGKGPNVMAGFLADQLVTCLVCNEISAAAQTALDDWGIQLYAGCSGNADERVAELIAGTLKATIQTARSSHHL